MVTGDRTWKRGLMGSTPSAPEPFTAIDLKYQNSYGGLGYAENPVGKGFGKQVDKNGKKVRPLPNITHLTDTLSTSRTRLEPAGFGPLAQTWKQRCSYLGTYKGKYLKEYWPWFPVDFDWHYFNAAPIDMQVKGYLVGDEKLNFANLHPQHGQYEASLPGLRIRCFVNRRIDPEPAALQFKEVNMRLDTLWVDMDGETLVLVWRGWCEVLSEEFEDIEHLFIVSELLKDPLKPVEHYRELLADRFSEMGKDEVDEPSEEPDKPDETKKDEEDIEAEIARAEQESRAQLIAAGIDPDNLPEQSEENKKKGGGAS